MPELVLYHGTDKKYFNDIVASGFIVKKNPRHWLGNGIYFFTDKALAEWWTTKPTHKFGQDIFSPIVIQCFFTAPDDSVLDLRKFNDYKYCSEKFAHFYNNFFLPLCGGKRIDLNKLRCTFFDWLFEINKYTAIVGTFHSCDQPYFQSMLRPDSFFEHLNLSYNEVQVCVSESQRKNLTGYKQLEGFAAQTI